MISPCKIFVKTILQFTYLWFQEVQGEGGSSRDWLVEWRVLSRHWAFEGRGEVQIRWVDYQTWEWSFGESIIWPCRMVKHAFSSSALQQSQLLETHNRDGYGWMNCRSLIAFSSLAHTLCEAEMKSIFQLLVQVCQSHNVLGFFVWASQRTNNCESSTSLKVMVWNMNALSVSVWTLAGFL